MNLSLYIARHLYNGGDSTHKVSRPAIRIAMLGIAIGMAVMIVSISVVIGFKHTIRDKVVGFGSNIVVSNYFTLQTPDKSQPINATPFILNKIKGLKGVRHVSRYSQKEGVLKTDDDFLGVLVKGVDAGFDTTFIAQSLQEGKLPEFSAYKTRRELLVSRSIADKLHLKVGSRVYAYFINKDDVKTRVFKISGIYQTNLTKYDDVYCYTDLFTVSKLNGWTCGEKVDDDSSDEVKYEVTGCEILVNNFDSLDVVEDQVIDNINKTEDDEGNVLTSATIKEINPQIFSWLDMLDMNVWIILILMICVAGFTMISGLLIIILERTSMIGLLKALGARNSLVRGTFRWLALFIVIKGMIFGNILGLGICYLQQYTGIIELDPQSYYVTEVPIEINWILIVLLNIATLIISVLALILPSFYASTVQPAKTMKIE